MPINFKVKLYVKKSCTKNFCIKKSAWKMLVRLTPGLACMKRQPEPVAGSWWSWPLPRRSHRPCNLKIKTSFFQNLMRVIFIKVKTTLTNTYWNYEWKFGRNVCSQYSIVQMEVYCNILENVPSWFEALKCLGFCQFKFT